MTTSTTFILDPPLGRYSSGTCVNWLAKVPHPAAPSVAAPAGPAPAAFTESRRGRARLVQPRPPAAARPARARAPRAAAPAPPAPATFRKPRRGRVRLVNLCLPAAGGAPRRASLV